MLLPQFYQKAPGKSTTAGFHGRNQTQHLKKILRKPLKSGKLASEIHLDVYKRQGTKIVEIGEEAALRAKYPQAEIIDAKGGVIMPALINAHTHIYSALARGLSCLLYTSRCV